MDLPPRQRLMLFRFCAYGFLKNLRFFEPFLLLFFTVEKGLSYTGFGTLIAVREVSIYLLEIPTGIIADVTGRRRAMVMAFVSYLVAFAVFSFTATFWAFAGAMVLFGAGEALRSGTHKSMIMQHLDLEGMADLRVHYYGTTRAVSRLGSAVSVVIAGAIVFSARNYQVVFLASMVPYVLGLLLMLTYPRALDGRVAGRLSVRALARHTTESFRGIWRTRELLRTLLNAATGNSFFKVAKDYLQPILKQSAAALAAATPLLAFARGETQRTAVVVAAIYVVVHLNEYFSSRRAGRLAEGVGNMAGALNLLFWALAGLFCAAGMLLWLGGLAASPALRYVGLGGAVLMLVLFYTVQNLRMPIVTGYLSDRTVAQQRATVLSAYSQLRAVIAAVLAPLFGLVADRAGLPAAFLASGAALVVAGLALRLDASTPNGGKP